MDLWNTKHLQPPPINTYRPSEHDIDLIKLRNVFDEGRNYFGNEHFLQAEQAVLSRIIYRMKTKFHSAKDFKSLEKLYHGLNNYFQVKLIRHLKYFTDLIPMKYNKDELYLPTKNMLDYILVRIQGLVKLLQRIFETAKIAAYQLNKRIQIGHFWNLAVVAFALVSRIYILVKHTTGFLCELYKKMLPFSPKLKNNGKQWLPEGYILPNDLKDWLNVKWIDEEDDIEIVTEVPKIIGFFNLVDDDDDDIQFCKEYIMVDEDEDIEIVNDYNNLKMNRLNKKKEKRNLLRGFNLDEDIGEIIDIEDTFIEDTNDPHEEINNKEDTEEIIEINDKILVESRSKTLLRGFNMLEDVGEIIVANEEVENILPQTGSIKNLHNDIILQVTSDSKSPVLLELSNEDTKENAEIQKNKLQNVTENEHKESKTQEVVKEVAQTDKEAVKKVVKKRKRNEIKSVLETISKKRKIEAEESAIMLSDDSLSDSVIVLDCSNVSNKKKKNQNRKKVKNKENLTLFKKNLNVAQNSVILLSDSDSISDNSITYKNLKKKNIKLCQNIIIPDEENSNVLEESNQSNNLEAHQEQEEHSDVQINPNSPIIKKNKVHNSDSIISLDDTLENTEIEAITNREIEESSINKNIHQEPQLIENDCLKNKSIENIDIKNLQQSDNSKANSSNKNILLDPKISISPISKKKAKKKRKTTIVEEENIEPESIDTENNFEANNNNTIFIDSEVTVSPINKKRCERKRKGTIIEENTKQENVTLLSNISSTEQETPLKKKFKNKKNKSFSNLDNSPTITLESNNSFIGQEMPLKKQFKNNKNKSFINNLENSPTVTSASITSFTEHETHLKKKFKNKNNKSNLDNSSTFTLVTGTPFTKQEMSLKKKNKSFSHLSPTASNTSFTEHETDLKKKFKNKTNKSNLDNSSTFSLVTGTPFTKQEILLKKIFKNKKNKSSSNLDISPTVTLASNNLFTGQEMPVKKKFKNKYNTRNLDNSTFSSASNTPFTEQAMYVKSPKQPAKNMELKNFGNLNSEITKSPIRKKIKDKQTLISDDTTKYENISYAKNESPVKKKIKKNKKRLEKKEVKITSTANKKRKSKQKMTQVHEQKLQNVENETPDRKRHKKKDTKLLKHENKPDGKQKNLLKKRLLKKSNDKNKPMKKIKKSELQWTVSKIQENTNKSKNLNKTI